jgi:hypothetical protein
MSNHAGVVAVADGFPGQRMLVLPRPRVRAFLDEGGTNHLVVTDCGYFPRAQYHGRTRLIPISQAVVLVCCPRVPHILTERMNRTRGPCGGFT